MKLLVSRDEAAQMCDVSVDTFDRRIRPHLREVRIRPTPQSDRALVRIPVRELERWIEESAARAVLE